MGEGLELPNGEVSKEADENGYKYFGVVDESRILDGYCFRARERGGL